MADALIMVAILAYESLRELTSQRLRYRTECKKSFSKGLLNLFSIAKMYNCW